MKKALTAHPKQTYCKKQHRKRLGEEKESRTQQERKQERKQTHKQERK